MSTRRRLIRLPQRCAAQVTRCLRLSPRSSVPPTHDFPQWPIASLLAVRRSAPHAAAIATCSSWWRWATWPPVDLVGVGLEVVVAQGLPGLQYCIDLALGCQGSVEIVIGGAAGGRGVFSKAELSHSGATRIAPSRSAIK